MISTYKEALFNCKLFANFNLDHLGAQKLASSVCRHVFQEYKYLLVSAAVD